MTWVRNGHFLYGLHNCAKWSQISLLKPQINPSVWHQFLKTIFFIKMVQYSRTQVLSVWSVYPESHWFVSHFPTPLTRHTLQCGSQAEIKKHGLFGLKKRSIPGELQSIYCTVPRLQMWGYTSDKLISTTLELRLPLCCRCARVVRM